jgi:hypothetical protein
LDNFHKVQSNSPPNTRIISRSIRMSPVSLCLVVKTPVPFWWQTF